MGACQQKNFGFEIKAKTVQIGTCGPIEHSASTQQANGRWCWLDRLSRANLPLPSAEQSKSVCASICVCCLLVVQLLAPQFVETRRKPLLPAPSSHWLRVIIFPPSHLILILIILLLTLSVPPPIPPNSPSFPPQHD